MRMKRWLMLMSAACCIGLLGGCSTMNEIHRDAAQRFVAQNHVTQEYASGIGAGKANPVGGPVISNLPYVSVTKIEHVVNDPAVFSQHVNINPPAGESVAALLQSISELSGIHVTADPDLLIDSVSSPTGADASSGGRDSTLALPPLPGLTGIGSGTGTGAGASRYIDSPINYSGDLQGLLDHISLVLDAKWRYDATRHEVHFYRFETKVFTIATSPGDANTSAAVDSGGTQSIQGQTGNTLRVSGSTATTTFKGDLSVWKNLGDTLKQMLSAQGTATLSQSTGTVAVRDRWDRVDAISQYIDQINRTLERMVQVNVTIYRVSASDADSRGINWSLLYNALGQYANRVGAAITTARVPISNGTSLVMSAPSQNQDGQPNAWAGSKFFLDALSTLGKSSVVSDTSVLTVNNQPAPVKVVQSQAYLAETTSLLSSGVSGNTGVVGAGATLTPGNVQTGITMQVLPSIQADGKRMLLQIMLSDSTLDSLTQFSSGGETIQLPQVTDREFMQRVWINSGQTLVLAGFQNNQSNNNTQTPFGRSTWIFGGNKSTSVARDALVIVITPVISSSQSEI